MVESEEVTNVPAGYMVAQSLIVRFINVPA